MHVSIFFREISKFRFLRTTHNNESFICSVYFNGVATSPCVTFSVTEEYRTRSRSDNVWFNCTCYHLPQATPGKRLHLQARGWGITSNCLVPGGRGRGNRNYLLVVLEKHVNSRTAWRSTARENAQNLLQTG